MKGLIKIPLTIAAIVILARIVLELVGAPTAITNILGVTWLNLAVPVYLGFRLATDSGPSPFKELFALVLQFTLYTRLMVMGTYVLAYGLDWNAFRFSVEGGGGVGHDLALQGMFVTPLMNLVITVMGGTIIGMILGSVALLIKRRNVAA